MAHISPASGTVRGRSGYLSTCIIFTWKQGIVSLAPDQNYKCHPAAMMMMEVTATLGPPHTIP